MTNRSKVVGRKNLPKPGVSTYTPSRFGSTNQAGANEIRLLEGMPSVVFSEAAWRTMRSYIDLVDTEIGWLGTVVRDGNSFFVDAVYLAEQEVSGVETLITEAGFNRLLLELLAGTASEPTVARALVDAATDSEALEEVMAELVESYGCDLESVMTRGNTIRFWGHSHVNMATNPSGPDDKAMESFRKEGFSYMLRGIFNKRGDARVDLFDYDRGVMVLNIPHQVHWEGVGDEAAIAAEIARKVTEKTYLTKPGGYRYSSRVGGYPDQTDWAEFGEGLPGDDSGDFVVDAASVQLLLRHCTAQGANAIATLRRHRLKIDDAGNVCREESGEIVLAEVFEPLPAKV